MHFTLCKRMHALTAASPVAALMLMAGLLAPQPYRRKRPPAPQTPATLDHAYPQKSVEQLHRVKAGMSPCTHT
ncbi:hypothetical protein JKP88DRAFT_226713 [Tribonema minus]|uniref:Uncharacterized protein n=1 Tax=Tribonema minus TaxID=303371 RepID=A0A836C8Q9_9STRA|nr:hypothetical protein JKP88DRAFT_226713 [Tribonema minus]